MMMIYLIKCVSAGMEAFFFRRAEKKERRVGIILVVGPTTGEIAIRLISGESIGKLLYIHLVL